MFIYIYFIDRWWWPYGHVGHVGHEAGAGKSLRMEINLKIDTAEHFHYWSFIMYGIGGSSWAMLAGQRCRLDGAFIEMQPIG